MVAMSASWHERRLAATQHFGRFRSEADIDAGSSRPLRGILAGTGCRILRQPGSSRRASWASLWHVWMALPKPEWIDPHRPITVEIAKLVNPHRALVSAN